MSAILNTGFLRENTLALFKISFLPPFSSLSCKFERVPGFCLDLNAFLLSGYLLSRSAWGPSEELP